jgi:hypothetical protein
MGGKALKDEIIPALYRLHALDYLENRHFKNIFEGVTDSVNHKSPK